MGATLLYGLDENENKVFIDDIENGRVYFCPSCKCPLISKRGEVRVHHFAHHSKTDHSMCAFQFYDLTEVTAVIEKKFSDKGYGVEVIYDLADNKKVIANAVVGEYAILIRDNAKFKEENVEEETKYFRSLGMKVIYYVNLKNEANRGDIEVIERKDSYIEVKWKKVSHRFLQNYSADVHDYDIFFDMSNDHNDKITPLSHYVLGRSTYIYNEKYDFSTDDFVDYCISKKEKDIKLGGIAVDISHYDIFNASIRHVNASETSSNGLDYSKYSGDPTGCEYYTASTKSLAEDLYVERNSNLVNEVNTTTTGNGKTIWELCSKEYENIVVSSVFSDSTKIIVQYLINLNDGKPETKCGKIVGKATWKDCNNEFHFGRERTFYDANEKKWKLIYAKKKSNELNKRETVTSILPEKESGANKCIANEHISTSKVVETKEKEESLELIDDVYANAKTLTQIVFDSLSEGKKEFYAKYIPLNKRTMQFENNKVYETKLDGSKGDEAPDWVQKDINNKEWLKED